MEGIVLTHYLSKKSLFYLDQAPALKKKEYSEILDYIDFLEAFEKKVFLKYLEKQNIGIVKEFNKIKKKRDKIVWEELEKKRKKKQEEDDKNKEEFLKKWSEEAILKVVKEINPNFCGLRFESDFRYYKYIDFVETVYFAYDILSMGYDVRIVLPAFFETLKSFRESDYTLLSKESRDVTFILCRSEKTREDYLQNLRERNKKRDKEKEIDEYKKV